MAVIAQADPYQGLIRKIGYSVGLEKIVERVQGVVALYVRDHAISASAFTELVEKEFGRRNAVDHFANFYGTLNLLRVTGRGQQQRKTLNSMGKVTTSPKAIEPLYQLDTLSILRRLFEDDDSKYEVALRVVLSQGIIEADGDIFLNALACDFDQSELKSRLESMVHEKRRKLGLVMKTPGLLAKIYQIVDIKNESSANHENHGESAPITRFGRRTEALDSSRRKTSLVPQSLGVVNVPVDYLGKVSISRRGWTEDLGFFDGHRKTAVGERLMRELANCVNWNNTDPKAALFWGYGTELEKIRLKPAELGACICEAWDLLTAIANSYAVDRQKASDEAPAADELFALLRKAFDLYKQGNSKGLIRNSLPLYVAEPVLAGWCVAEGRGLPDFHGILSTEYSKKVRRIQKMIIRGTAGALFFMS